jgi:hypothetical protein
MGAMRWKICSFGAVVLTVIVGACAQFAGLQDYTSGDPTQPDSSVSPAKLEPSAYEASDERGEGALDDAGGQGEGSTPGPDLEPDDGAADAAETSVPGEPSDAGKPTDASLVPDGYACGADTCGGCCNAAGDCVGGQSVATCGSGGPKCKDCTSAGACSQGECTTPLPDAGPPPICMFGSCSNSNCAFFPIQGACCKLDQTCGCQWTAFAPCL